MVLNETESSSFTYEVTDDHKWATLASPLVILFSYFFLAIETRELFKPKVCMHAKKYLLLFDRNTVINIAINDLYYH